jgi:hypothetical protein
MQIIRFTKQIGTKAYYGQFGELIYPLRNEATAGMSLNVFAVKPDEYEVIELKSILGATLYAEDDALPHDREKLVDAYRRITGTEFSGRRPLVTYENSDCTWEIYDKYVICRSYPGNNAIYERLL